jgi:hypothetical protein
MGKKIKGFKCVFKNDDCMQVVIGDEFACYDKSERKVCSIKRIDTVDDCSYCFNIKLENGHNMEIILREYYCLEINWEDEKQCT